MKIFHKMFLLNLLSEIVAIWVFFMSFLLSIGSILFLIEQKIKIKFWVCKTTKGKHLFTNNMCTSLMT